MAEKRDIVYAGLGVRFLAGIVDFIIVVFLTFAVIRIFNLAGMKINVYNENNEVISISEAMTQIAEKTGEAIKEEKTEEWFEKAMPKLEEKTKKNLNMIAIFVSAVYSVYFVSSKKQGTPGKQLFKLMIIDRKHGRMSILNSFVRYVAKRITNLLFFVGYLPILFTKEKVSLHDFLSNTRVVRIKK